MYSAKLVAALVLLGGLFSFAAPAFSYPIAPAQTSQFSSNAIEQVGWRCGPGRHMDRWGRCVPNRMRAYCGPGRHLNRYGECVRNRPAYRACPRGTHLTPRGYCVRNW